MIFTADEIRGAEHGASDTESEVDENTRPGPNSWNEWNRLQRRDAGRYIDMPGLGVLLTIMVHSLQPLVSLLHYIEKVSTDAWIQEQQASCLSGQPCWTRAEDHHQHEFLIHHLIHGSTPFFPWLCDPVVLRCFSL